MAHSGKFVAYYRVSTTKQGKSGLGLEAQQSQVAAYLNGGKWQIVEEFVEVESRRKVRANAMERRTAERAADIGPTIAELQAGGATSLRAIAAALNERSIPTARGKGEWSAVQVQRVMGRFA
ncbi:recombinase family protein [Tardiphaga sp. 813_E8_N1_3]|uniref:recombinase family protein n=1 Tax=Tardiphaga sp. 813_E8_N1_3 TaxID=3240760 RepID=UPI003F216B00